MDPNGIAGPDDFQQMFCKELIGLFVFLKKILIIDYIRREVMEQRPNRGIAKSIIVLIINFRIDKERFNFKFLCRAAAFLTTFFQKNPPRRPKLFASNVSFVDSCSK